MTIAVLIIGYFVFVWIILRMIVPYMGFRKAKIADPVPIHLQEAIQNIKSQSSNQADALRFSYEYVVRTYYGNRIKTVSNFWRAFGRYDNKTAGFLPCNMQNHLLRNILVKSGFFSDTDINVKVTPFNFFIHQYLQVRIGKKFTDVDPWSHFLGLNIGERSSFFG